MRMELFTVHDVRVIARDMDHPECVNFGPDGVGYAGGEAGQVYKFGLDGRVELVGNTGGGIGGFCLDADSNLYECNYGKPQVHKVTPTGNVTVHSSGTSHRAAVYPNYPVFDAAGNLYYSDSGDFYRPNGCLFVVRPDCTTEHLYGDHLHFPNGMAIDPSEKWLYVVQSSAANILRFPLDNGLVGAPEVYVNLPGTVPDGLTFSQSGSLYVACYVPDVILKITPNRQVCTVVRDTAADFLNRPANVAFAPNTTLLCFANLGGFTVNAIDVGEPGQPLFYPKIRG